MYLGTYFKKELNNIDVLRKIISPISFNTELYKEKDSQNFEILALKLPSAITWVKTPWKEEINLLVGKYILL